MSQLTKSQIMQLVKEGKARECFAPTVHGEFDVAHTWIVAGAHGEYITFDLDADFIAEVKATHDWCPQRVAEITEKQAHEKVLLLWDSSDQSHCLIDGTHRIIKLFELGGRQAEGVVLPVEHAVRPSENYIRLREHEWGAFTIEGDKVVPLGGAA